MSDKIAEIRARHEAGAPGEMPIVALAQADADRELLLDEVERLQGLLKGFSRDMAEEVERLTRERDEARAEVENLYDQVHRWVDDRAKAQLQADRLREQNYELQRERDEARAEVERLRGALEMVRDADNDCRLDGLATIPDVARRKIDDALEGRP